MEILKELQIPEIFYWCSIGVDIYSAIATLFLYCSKCCAGCMNIDIESMSRNLKTKRRSLTASLSPASFSARNVAVLLTYIW